MQHISNEALKDIKCSACGNYLSKFPILIQKETGESICRRCSLLENEIKNYIRNSALERLVKHLKFPCKYQERGCKKLLRPTTLEHHESLCHFQLITCPLVKDCDWIGNSLKLIQHSTEHTKLVIKNNTIHLNLTEDYLKTYLLTFEEENFIVQLEYHDSQLKCIVYYTGWKCYEIYNFNLVLSGISLRTVRVLPIPCCNYFEKELVPIFHSAYAIEGNNNLTGRIVITKNYSNLTVTRNCFYCVRKIEGDFNNCENGHHKICDDCVETHNNQCNYPLIECNQKEDFDFHCKNVVRNCPYTSNNEKTLMEHEKECIFDDDFKVKGLDCCEKPFKKFVDYVSHIENCDSTDFGVNGEIEWLNTSSDHHVKIPFDNYIFSVYFKTERKPYELYAMLKFQKNVSHKYLFEVQFLNWDNFDEVVLTGRQRVSDEKGKYLFLVDDKSVKDAIMNTLICYKIRFFRKVD